MKFSESGNFHCFSFLSKVEIFILHSDTFTIFDSSIFTYHQVTYSDHKFVEYILHTRHCSK